MVVRCITSAAMLAVALAAPAGAATLLSNGPPVTSFPIGASTGLGESVAVTTATTLTNLGFWSATPTGGNLKYLIFDASGSTLLFSVTAASTNIGTTAALALSPAFSFSLAAGSTYIFGVISDATTRLGYQTVSDIDVSQNGLATTGNIAYFYGYSSPVFQGFGSGLKGVLVLQGVQDTVPEPAAWAMMLAGFGMVGGAIRYRHRTNAAAVA